MDLRPTVTTVVGSTHLTQRAGDVDRHGDITIGKKQEGSSPLSSSEVSDLTVHRDEGFVEEENCREDRIVALSKCDFMDSFMGSPEAATLEYVSK